MRLLLLFPGEDGDQGLHGGLLVFALGADHDPVAVLGPERHQLQRALDIRLHAVLYDYYVRGVALGLLDEPRRWPGVQPRLRNDDRVSFHHVPTPSVRHLSPFRPGRLPGPTCGWCSRSATRLAPSHSRSSQSKSTSWRA